MLLTVEGAEARVLCSATAVYTSWSFQLDRRPLGTAGRQQKKARRVNYAGPLAVRGVTATTFLLHRVKFEARGGYAGNGKQPASFVASRSTQSRFDRHRLWRGTGASRSGSMSVSTHTRSLCAQSPAQSEQWCCWFCRSQILFGSAEIWAVRAPSQRCSSMTNVRARMPT